MSEYVKLIIVVVQYLFVVVKYLSAIYAMYPLNCYVLTAKTTVH